MRSITALIPAPVAKANSTRKMNFMITGGVGLIGALLVLVATSTYGPGVGTDSADYIALANNWVQQVGQNSLEPIVTFDDGIIYSW